MANNIIKRALISVSDKTGIIDFARYLNSRDIEILSTGGTAELLQQHKIPVVEVCEYTHFPEMMGGRVKTLHPKIHGGILGRRGQDDDVMVAHDIRPIDLVIVNLYPFEKTIAQPNCDLDLAVENIDIGGPTLLRAAAKNYAAVTVIVDSHDYQTVINEIETNHGATSPHTRFLLAQKVFAHTARYDAAIANYLTNVQTESEQNLFPQMYAPQFIKKQEMRYGENPHQQAALYIDADISNQPNGTTVAAQQLQGKPLSFNNIADTDAALECVKNFLPAPACVIVKHANPCGVATASTQLEAYQQAFTTDPVSAFGGIIAFNTELTLETAEVLLAKQFVEVVIAPSVTPEAITAFAQKPNIRLLNCGPLRAATTQLSFDYKRINSGLLVQENDIAIINPAELQVVTQRTPTAQELQDLLFAWKVVKYVKSNAIVYTKNNATLGIGAGQMSRVHSAKIAAIKAAEQNLDIKGAVMASDAFFPFRDGIDTAANAGITAVIQPGGSMRDTEVIQAADEANIAMVFTGIRHFRH